MSARRALSRSLDQVAGRLSPAIRATTAPPWPLPRSPALPHSLPRAPSTSQLQSSRSLFSPAHAHAGIPKGFTNAARDAATWQAPGGLAAGIRQHAEALALSWRARVGSGPRLPWGPLLPRGSGSLAAPALWKGLSLGVSCAAAASAALLPSTAATCDDAPFTPPSPSGSDDDVGSLPDLLRALIALVWPLLVLLASFFALKDDPMVSAANLAVLCWGLRPDEESLQIWLEQKRSEELKDKNGLDWAKSQVMGAVVKVEYTDYWFFSLAKVSSLTSSYTVVGILNNWFTVATTKQSLQFPGLRDRDSEY